MTHLHGPGACGGHPGADARYPSGEEIHAGDRILFQGEAAEVMFVKQRDEYAAGVQRADWTFLEGDIIGLRFASGRTCLYDSFCEHDAVTLRSRTGRN